MSSDYRTIHHEVRLRSYEPLLMGCLWLYEKWWATDNYTIFSCKNWWLYLLLSVAKWILGSYELYSIVWNTGEQLIIVRSSVASFDKFVNCRSWYKARMRSQTIVLSAVKWISGSYEPCVRADEDHMSHAYGLLTIVWIIGERLTVVHVRSSITSIGKFANQNEVRTNYTCYYWRSYKTQVCDWWLYDLLLQVVTRSWTTRADDWAIRGQMITKIVRASFYWPTIVRSSVTNNKYWQARVL